MIPFAIFAEQAAAADQAPAAVPQIAIAALALLLVAVAAPAWIFVAGRLLRRQAPLAYEGRRQVPWTGADVLVVCVLSFLWQLFPLAVVQMRGFEPPDGGKLPPGSEMTVLLAQTVAGVGSFAVAALWLAVRSRAGCDALGCTPGEWRRDLASGMIASTFIIPPLLGMQGVLTFLMPSEHPLITTIKQNRALLPVVAVLAVLVAPLLEEFLFRVVLQGWLEKAEQALRRSAPEKFSLPRGVLPVLVSSIAFAAAHYGHGADPLPLFLLALVLGYLYHQTHRLWPSLVLHMSLNALTTFLLWRVVSK